MSFKALPVGEMVCAQIKMAAQICLPTQPKSPSLERASVSCVKLVSGSSCAMGLPI